ncbi:peptidoglycan recognition protein family protein [Cupriavidus campinensis]
MLFIDKNGRVDAERVKVKIFPNIERGPMEKVNGIVVHQTYSPTAESTFNSYRDKGANGAHFLIDKDGTIYQTASLLKRTNHVGYLKSRCIATHVCSPTEFRLASSIRGTKKLSDHEYNKTWPQRYPSNKDAIGIELVGMAYAKDIPRKNEKPNLVYEDVTEAQNLSLRWLITELVRSFKVSTSEIYRHPHVSYKIVTEASTAKW